jgi:hypothetical protein
VHGVAPDHMVQFAGTGKPGIARDAALGGALILR